MKRNFYSLLMIVASCFLPAILYGQGASTYSFAESTGTYSVIAGTTSSATGDDGTENGLPIGFTFMFGGNPYTTFSVTTNGFLKLGSNITTGTANYSNAIGAASNAPLIAGFWDDNGMSASAGGDIQYLTQGTPGSQTLTVQWTNCAFATGGTGANVDFQIVLHETSNIVEIIYDGISATTSGVTAAIGITSSSGDYLSVTPGAPATASSTAANNSVGADATVITSGLLYTFTPPPPCSGTPPVAQTTASVAGPLCGGTPFTLGVTGLPVESGFSYEFQSSPAGLNNWTSLGAAQTSPTFSIASQTAATDYQVIVTCTNSGLSTTATLVSIGQNLFSSCYCTPTSNCTNEGIVNVTFDALNNSSVYCNGGYEDFTGLGALATVSQAQVVPITVSARINDVSNNYAGVWIDFDQSGTFDAGEYTSLGASGALPSPPDTFAFTANITVPANAAIGVTRMRVRSANGSGITATSACNTGTVYGEFEDYLVTINAGTACSGAPTAGTVSGPTVICSGVDFALTASGYTTGVVGLSYEWQVYDLLTSSWVPAPGTNNDTSYTVVGGVLAPTDFRFVITCANGGQQDFSPAFTAAPTIISTFPFLEDFENTSASRPCWNIVNSNSDNDEWEFISSTTYAHSGAYKAQMYTDGNSGSNDDWLISPAIGLTGNQKLTYWYRVRSSGEPNDYTILLSTTGNSPADFTTVLKPLTSASNTSYAKDSVDLSAYTGTVFIAFQVPPGGLDGWYLYIDDVSIEDLPPGCSGTPDPVTITGITDACSGVDFTLNATGYSFGPGIIWEWQVFDLLTSAWVPAPGTNNTPSYTAVGGITVPTDYRFVTTCTNGGQTDISATQSVNINSPTQCYCTPTYSNGGTNDYVASVQLGTLSNNTSAAGNVSPYYQDYTSQQPGTIAIPDLAAGLSYNVTLTFGPDGSQYSRVWVDFNQDGVFDATESFTTGSNAGGSGTAVIAINVPITATGGNTRMRIRGADDSQPSDTQPCGASNSSYGEAEDYLVNILAATSCAGAPDPVTVGISGGGTAVCTGEDFTLTATGMSFGLGISYQWEMFDLLTSAWVPVSGETNPTYTVLGGITTPTDYRFITTCSNGGQQDITAAFSVGINPFYNCYCTPVSSCTNEGIINVTFDALNNSSDYCNGGVGYEDFGSLGAIVSVDQAEVVSMSVSAHINSNPASVGVWIDYDQNGTFDASEYTLLGSTNGISPLPDTQVYTGNVVIDANAIPGITRMRVRSANQSGITAGSACNTGTVYGEFEDYLITINAGLACAGTPSAGTVASSVPSVACSGVPVIISSTGFSNGVTGLTFQWQESTDGVSFTNVGTAALNYSDYNVASVSQTMYYQLEVTCTNGGGVAYSNIASVQLAPPSAPWTYDVETQPASTSGTMSECWAASTSTGYEWNVSGNGGTPSLGTGPSSAHSGTHFFFTEASSGTSGDVALLESPQVDISPLTAPLLEFYYHMFGTNINKLYISAYDGITWTTIDSIVGQQQTANADPWLKKSVPLTGYTGIIQVRFEAVSGGTYEGDISIDDISIIETPSCLTTASLAASNITNSSADINWDPVAGAAGYEYVLDQNAANPAGAGITTTDTFYNATGLTDLTTYYFHLRTDCGSGSYSVWTTVSFTTPPAADFCSGAIVIPTSGPYTSVAVNTVNATDAGDPGVTAQVNAHKGIWFTFTPPGTGSYTISSCQSDAPLSTINDNVIGVFTSAAGCSGPFTEIASNDDGCSTLGLQGFVTTSLTAGTQYYILVYGYNTNTGDAQVNISGAPLAIKLVNISAANIGSANRVNWITAEEEKSDYFELERSADGKNFATITSMKANGEASTYTYVDQEPLKGTSYYRLKMYDASGRFEYSKVVWAAMNGKTEFSVRAYPNPVGNDKLTIEAYGTDGSNATIMITDITGKVIKAVTMINGMATIDMNGMAQGIYLVKYTDSHNSQTIKVNKQ